MDHELMLLIAGILGAGLFCQWLAWRLGIPSILLLLTTGFLAGPVLGLLEPRVFLGELFFPVISLSVAVILCEGALTLKWQEVQQVAGVVRNLITVGALVTWIGGILAARLIMGLPWELAVLFGALIIVTGPTVIGPLLRNVRPTRRVASILRWEGILIDPLGALVVVLVFNFIVASGPAGHLGLQTIITFLRIALIGTVSGLIGGYFVALILKRYLVPDYLREITVLIVIVIVFAVSDYLVGESGLLAVTVMGLLLANLGLSQLHHVWFFKEKLSILLISSLFILLAANFTLADLALLDWRSLILLAVVIFVVRPAAILVSTIGSELVRGERLFLAWIAPRGIVAAAVSSLFAFRLVELGYGEARLLASLTFLIIVGTVVLQGSTAKLVARQLGVAEAEPQGFLLMGAHAFSQAFGLALQEEGFLVRLVDTNWENVEQARNRGLDVYHGNILSEFDQEELDLVGLGRLIALTRNDEANAIACVHLQDEFGSSEVYQLAPKSLTATTVAGQPEPHLAAIAAPSEGRQSILQRLGGPDGGNSTATLAATSATDDSAEQVKVPSLYRLGRLFPNRPYSSEALVTAIEQGATIERIELTPEFSYTEYSRDRNDNFVPLVAFKGSQVLIPTMDAPFNPQPGWRLLSLVF